MAATISKRTKKTLGAQSQIYSDLFVVDNKRKDQANDASRIKSPASITQISSRLFWVKKSRAGTYNINSLPKSAQSCFG